MTPLLLSTNCSLVQFERQQDFIDNVDHGLASDDVGRGDPSLERSNRLDLDECIHSEDSQLGGSGVQGSEADAILVRDL